MNEVKVVRYGTDHVRCGEINMEATLAAYQDTLMTEMENDEKITVEADRFFDKQKEDFSVKVESLVVNLTSKLVADPDDIAAVEAMSESVANFLVNHPRFKVKAGKGGGVSRVKKPSTL